MDLKLVPSTIVETLDRDGSQRYNDLLKKTARLHSDLTEDKFKDILMELEIQGLVRVQEMTRGKKLVELA
ncbi:MAG: hypothetical protein ACLFVP_08460 [Candidatus Bathyarchaeia archaeon]